MAIGAIHGMHIHAMKNIEVWYSAISNVTGQGS